MPEETRLPAVLASDNALARRFPIMNPDEAAEAREILAQNLGPRGMGPQQLDRIKVPSGGATAWLTQGLDGEEHHKELSGIIIAWDEGRLYWKIAYDQRGKSKLPPDCHSNDGFWGVGDPGGECAHCVFNEFGSDPKGGRGKACKEIRRLLVLRDNHLLPEILTVPPTSLKNCREYLQRLGNVSVPYWGLITTFRLEKTSNPDGVDYARVVFAAGVRLTKEERQVLKPFQQQMAALLTPIDLGTDDYEYAPPEGETGEESAASADSGEAK